MACRAQQRQRSRSVNQIRGRKRKTDERKCENTDSCECVRVGGSGSSLSCCRDRPHKQSCKAPDESSDDTIYETEECISCDKVATFQRSYAIGEVRK